MDDPRALKEKIRADAGRQGYRLNPDAAFVDGLVEGLAANAARYGYASCPCRLASGVREEDRDIVCPCDYRDADVAEFGACYCGLYVSERVAGGAPPGPIPERRPPPEKRARPGSARAVILPGELAYPVWRCRACGYLCARDAPPDACPICGAGADRFERFA